MKRYFKTLFLAVAMTCAMPAMAQNQTVQGTVVDETGEPVIGATIKVEGTKTLAVTDFDGNYKIEVPKGGKIIVSYIGYKEATTTGGRLQLEEDNSQLQEVVVVGYGVQKKAHLTGSVGTVDMNEIQDLANGDLASSLSGLVNGLGVSGGDARPGERATMSIRDVNSLSDIGSNAQEPLYVIDGYIYPNDVKVGNTTQNLGAEAFNNLDPSEVESISVLKDASAAVYGARAANGVILVTTKKGKMGEPRISYSGTFGFTDEVSRPKMLSAYDYGRLYNIFAAADPTNTSLNHKDALFQLDELQAMKGTNYDLLDKYWKTAFTHKHSVNVSGATEKINYFAGLGYFQQDGNLGKLDYDRWNFRAGVDVKISKWLSANLSVSGDYGKKNKPLIKVGGSGTDDYNVLLTRPYYMPEQVGEYDINSFGPSNVSKSNRQTYSYDVLQNNGDFSKNMNSNLAINGSINYDFGWSKILKGLKLKLSYSKSINTDKTNEYGSAYNLYTMIHRYGSGRHLYTPTSGDDPAFDYLAEGNFNPISYSNGDYLSRTMTRTDNYQINFTAQYSRKFGLHDVSGLFSIEKSEAESEYNYASVSSPYEFTTYQSNSMSDDGVSSGQFTRAESGTLSYIGRVNYAYADKYLLEFLVRADASTKFSPKNFWGVFPAMSAGWVISEENWFKDKVKWVDYLKLRASFGLTGRDNLTAWQWMQVYNLDKNKGSVFGVDPSTKSGSRITINKNTAAINEEVHWDKSYKMNWGLDTRFLNQRLGVTVDFYKEWNREMLLNMKEEVPTTVGTQSASTNLGEMNSWGIEVSLTWRDKIGKDIKYHIGINTGYSDNKVLNMSWATNYLYRQIVYGSRTDIGTWGMQCLGMFRSFQDIEEYFDKYNITSYMGLTKDKVRPGMLIYKDVRGAYNAETGTYAGPDGIVDENNDQVELSHRNNIYGFTINSGAEWKSLSVSFQFGANWGGYTTLPAAAYKVASNYSIENYNFPSFWNPDNVFAYQNVYDESGNLVVAQNRDACYPIMVGGDFASVNGATSSFWRVSAARVTLNRVTIAYTLPKEWFKKIGLQGARINVTGQNLVNFYNPYPDHFTNPMAGSYGSYPNLRKWTIGVSLTF